RAHDARQSTVPNGSGDQRRIILSKRLAGEVTGQCLFPTRRPWSVGATHGGWNEVVRNYVLDSNRRFFSGGGVALTHHRRLENCGRVARGSRVYHKPRDRAGLAVGAWRRIPGST